MLKNRECIMRLPILASSMKNYKGSFIFEKSYYSTLSHRLFSNKAVNLFLSVITFKITTRELQREAPRISKEEAFRKQLQTHKYFHISLALTKYSSGKTNYMGQLLH